MSLCKLEKCVHLLSSERTQHHTKSHSLVSDVLVGSQCYSPLKQVLLCTAQPHTDGSRSQRLCVVLLVLPEDMMDFSLASFTCASATAWRPCLWSWTLFPLLLKAGAVSVISGSSSISQKITCISCLSQNRISKFYLGSFVISHLTNI